MRSMSRLMILSATGNHLFSNNRSPDMSAVEWIVDELRLSFFDSAIGVVRLLIAYVFLKLAFEEYRRRSA